MERKEKKTEKFTVMIIPDAHADVKSFNCPRWLLYVIAGSLVISLTVFSYLAFTYGAYKITKAENDRLKEINNIQAVELAELEKDTRQALKKLEDISQMDTKIREMVGLQEKADNSVVSRSQGGVGLSSRNISILSGTSSFELPREESIIMWQATGEEDNSITAIRNRLEEINYLLDKQEVALEELESDVIKRLDYLEAIPNEWPVKGKLTSRFGWRKNPFNSRTMEYHEGLDIAAPYGTAVKAAGEGKVTFTGWKPVYGYTVVIDHGYGYISQYAHNSKISVKKGQVVTTGQVIARVGSTGRSTGPHVDFRISYKGKWIDPLTVLK
ncbi:MAG: M23 family metallopeptidase [Clostridia bacterium]|nr:M23 family metallopeptidase [Clostridia bacterium]